MANAEDAGSAASAPAPESAEMARMRETAKNRRRRLIYNNDSGDVYAAGANTPDGFLAVRMKPVLDTQVDSVFYCTGATTMFSHQAKVGEVYGKYVTGGALAKNVEGLKAAGTDALELAIKFCKENDLEVFFTHRINDIHDSMDSCSFELSTWKREHPEYCLGKREDRDKYSLNDPRYWWSSLDFQVNEVRAYLLAIIDDVLARYDVDGIEIDYFRSPMFFRPNLTYKRVSANQVDILTRFQRRVRQIAYRHGSRRGRPILVATRVPMTKAVCRHVGIDIEAWLKQDLLDILTTGGGYVPFTMPTRELVDLGHAHDVPVYPTISASGMRGHSSIEGWRGAAANAWQAGADGVYLFNTFPSTPGHPHFTQLGDPGSLATMNKLFVVDNHTVLEGDLRQGIVQSQILPVKLAAGGKPRQINLPVGDDIAGAAKAGTLAGATLRIRFEGMTSEDAVEVRLGGEPIASEGQRGDDGWVSYDVDPATWLRGDNALSFHVTSGRAGGEAKIAVAAVELNVTYK